MIRPILFALLTLIAFVPAASAKGIEVGKAIPSMTAKDQAGKEQSFDSLKGSKGLTIVFVRSVEWCPFCQRQVMDLSENASKFKDAGYPVVAISYDSSDKLAQFAAKFKTNIPLLSDPRSDVIKAFGIFNDNYAKGTLAYGTPFPGVYVVNADKTVKAKFFKEGVQDRPTVDELLASMKEPVAMDPAEEFPQEPAAPVMTETQTDPVPAADPTSIENAPVDAATPPAAPVLETTPEMPPAPAPMMEESAAPKIEEPAVPSADVNSTPSSEPEPMEFVPPADEMPVDEDASAGEPGSSGF